MPRTACTGIVPRENGFVCLLLLTLGAFTGGCDDRLSAPSATNSGSCTPPDNATGGHELPGCPSPEEEDECDAHFRACRRSSTNPEKECEEAFSCLAQPKCDVECMPERDESADVYGGLCEVVAPPSLTRDELDGMYISLVWRLFIALNHPQHFVNHEPGWTHWYDPHAELTREQVDSYGCDRPTESELLAYQAPTWKTGTSIAGRLPPHDNPLYYGKSGEARAVRLQSLIGPDLEHQRQVYEGMQNQVTWASYSRKIPDERWAKRFESLGPVHLKAAWIELDQKDDRREKLLCRAVRRGGTSECLIALHLALKTFHSGNFWTWSTFEYRDLEVLDLNDCADETECGVECEAQPDGAAKEDDWYPDQRAYNRLVRSLNDSVQADLSRHSGLSILSNYDLVGVQRPVGERSTEAASGQGGSDSLDDESQRAFDAWPPYLSSRIIEWDRPKSSCAGCHSQALIWHQTPSGALEQIWVEENPKKNPGVPRSDMFWGYASTGCVSR